MDRPPDMSEAVTALHKEAPCAPQPESTTHAALSLAGVKGGMDLSPAKIEIESNRTRAEVKRGCGGQRGLNKSYWAWI